MVIRKPSLSVGEARRLAEVRAAAGHKPEKAGEVTSPPAPIIRSSRRGHTAPNPATPNAATPAPTRVAPSLAKKAPLSAAPRPPSAVANADVVLGVQPLPAPVPKTQVFVSALLPAAGVSSVFEILLRQYSPHKALQMILRRALDDYEDLLADGSFQKEPETYLSGGTAAAGALVQTSHMMPRPLLALARAHFDPLGLESTRAFGFKLATAALAVFFSKEAKHGS